MFSEIESFGKRNRIYYLDRFKRVFQSIDFSLWLIPSLMVIVSTFLIASTQRQSSYADWSHHLLTGVLGLLIAIFIAQIPLERIRPFLIYIYLITIVSLFAVKLFGTSALGAQRWVNIAGISFQPSEFAKLTSILLLADIMDRRKTFKPINIIRPLSVISLPWILVFIQPDLGSSLVFGSFLLAMLYWSGMPIEWLIFLVSLLITSIFSGFFGIKVITWIVCLGLFTYRTTSNKKIDTILVLFSHSLIAYITPFLWNYGLKDYQKERLVLFLDPAKDPLGGGYHLLQSTVGIGSGGLFGTGLLRGHLTKLSFIPEQHTDFIFSALGEETGFIGTLLVVFGFFFLIIKLLKLAKTSRTDFESLVIVGVGTMFMFQVVVNIFMTIGLGPVTGIPLPFMSYGRTALLMSFVALGFCLSVSKRSQSFRKKF